MDYNSQGQSRRVSGGWSLRGFTLTRTSTCVLGYAPRGEPMTSGRLPDRDYMDPGSPRLVRDYMDPSMVVPARGVLRRPKSGRGPNTGRPQRSSNGNGLRSNRAALAAGDAAAAALPLVALAPPRASSRPSAGKGSLGGIFVSFKMRDFRYLTLSTLAAGFAQWAQQLSLFALIYEMTGSSVQLGTVAAFRGLVGAALSPYGGYLAERYPRKAVNVWSTALGAVLAAILAGLVLTGRAVPWHVYVMALGTGLSQSINQPTRQALVYDVTTDETLPNAIAMNSMVQNISRVMGPSAFGTMIGIWGVGAGLVALAVLHTLALLLTMLISSQTRQVQMARGASFFRRIWEGFEYSWHDRRVLGLIVITTIPSLLVYPYIPFLKVVSETVLFRGNAGFGWLSSMMGWGSLIGLFFLAYTATARARGKLMIACFLLYTALLVGFSASSNYYLSLFILAAAGIPHGVAMAINQTLVQQNIPNELRGRVMSVFQLSQFVQPIGSLPMAAAVEYWGAQFGIGIFMATALVAFAIFGLTWKSVRQIQ